MLVACLPRLNGDEGSPLWWVEPMAHSQRRLVHALHGLGNHYRQGGMGVRLQLPEDSSAGESGLQSSLG